MKGSSSYIKSFCTKLLELSASAAYVHLGVHFDRLTESSNHSISKEKAISESAILLSSMVDALGAIFHALAGSVQELEVEKDQTPCRECGVKVNNFFDEARRYLKTAGDELISEARGGPNGKLVGPIITPEAILIKLIERLVCGVFRSGNVDIINMLEQCLENLVRDMHT